MNFLLLGLYLLSFLAGTACVAICVIAYIRMQDRRLWYFSFLMLAFFLLVLVNDSFSTILPLLSLDVGVNPFLHLTLVALLDIVFILFGLHFIHAFARVPFSGVLRWVLYASALLPLGYLFAAAFSYLEATQVRWLISIQTDLYLIYTSVLFFRAIRRETDIFYRRFMITVLVCNIVFIPLDLYFSVSKWNNSASDFPAWLGNLYLLCGSIVLIIVLAKQYLARLDQGLPPLDQKSRFEDPSYGLTFRELEILALVRQGYSNKVIARQLSISEATVKNHLTNIFRKTKAQSRLEFLRS